MPVEGRGLSYRRTQEATKDRGIGDEPNNSIQCSEVADGVACKSEGIAQLSFPCAVRQGVSERYSGLCSGCNSRPGTGSLHPVAIEAAAEATKLSELSV